MNLSKLFEMQRILDTRIVQEKELDESDLLLKKIDAFRVELHELENETKHFKYWSSKEPDQSKVLEEYVDGLHFILSIGIELNITESKLDPIKHESLAEQFRWVNRDAVELYEAIDCGFDLNIYYDLLFIRFIVLGEMLGFTWEQIEQAYRDKNIVNHERQANGY